MFKKIIRKIKHSALRVQNFILPTESILSSKEKWNLLAQKNAKYFVLTNQGQGINEEEFRRSGHFDYENLIKNDDLVRSLIPNPKSAKVVEIGCGIGRISEFIAQDFSEVSGIDISEEMVSQAKTRLCRIKNLHFFPTSGLNYPFPNDYFDFAFSFIVFQHMPSKAVVKKNFEEIFRVLKPGGLAKIQVRGIEVKKGDWFYGPAFSLQDVFDLIKGLKLNLIHHQDEGEKYFWLYFQKT